MRPARLLTCLTPTLRNIIGFFIMGIINNLSYVVVLSAAQTMVNNFHKGKLFPVIQWADVAVGAGARYANGWALKDTAYSFRVIMAFCLNSIGLIGVMCSQEVGFWFLVISIVFIGASSSFGEATLLGYLRLFDPELLGAWGSGTGMAGVGGAGLYIGLAAVFGTDLKWIFFVVLLLEVLYVFAFFGLIVGPKGKPATCKIGGQSTSSLEDSLMNDAPDNVVAEFKVDPYSEPVVQETELQRTTRTLKLIWWIATQLMLVYLLEYLVSVGLADAANLDCEKFSDVGGCSSQAECKWKFRASGDHCVFNLGHSANDWARTNAYTILQLCYQIGVFISRSSLKFIKIQKVWVLTVLQLGNVILWMLQDKFRFLNIWLQFFLMIYVGLLGGASYVNVFHQIYISERVPDKDREVAVNIAALFINAGIISASLIELLLDYTFLEKIVSGD